MDAIVPFRQFILKVASRCDLACKGCYVYEHADQSWHGRPTVMPNDVAGQVAFRIAEHAREHRLDVAHVVLHGGEPLLAGLSRLEWVARELNKALDGVSRLDLRIHTNGVLLNEKFCEMFEAQNIKVGVSIDGDRDSNDRHRRYANGRSSFDRVVSSIDLLRRSHKQLYAGLLCTIDVRNDPLAVYEALVALEPPRVDFLLPHATWDTPPPRPSGKDDTYAEWLIRIHERWVADGMPMAIRMFDSINSMAIGEFSGTESLGLTPSDLVVIETDGSYEQADSLKTAYDGAPATGLDVYQHSLADVARHPGVVARQQGLQALAAECQKCPLVRNCGGGLYAHRYKSGSGFTNPSVYCSDLQVLIPHVQNDYVRRLHSMPVSTLERLARGIVGGAEISRLRAPQRSLTRSLVAKRARDFDDAWELLAQLDRDHPAATHYVLDHPYVRAWAADRQQQDPDYPTAIAAAAAVRAGISTSVNLSAYSGTVYLPTLGRMRLDGAEPVAVEIGANSFVIRTRDREYAENCVNWDPIRSLIVPGFAVQIDDIDPKRDCYGAPVADRLTQAEFDIWQQVFAESWSLIQTRFPEHAEAVRSALRVITPIAGAGGRGASNRRSYGAIALTAEQDPETFATLMMRNFMTAQLGALLDMFDLVGQDASVESELYETYARLATIDFRTADGMALDEVRDIVARLLGRRLPDVGRRFVEEMGAALTARARLAAREGTR
jgi:uncharacterized protein